MDENNFILGPEVKLLEDKVANYCGTKFAVGVASGTDALVFALISLGIGDGDEVITTPFTFIATAEAISRTRARPVFSDIEYDTYNICPEKIEEKITKNTKAILPVHLYGMPCDMDKIIALAKKHNLKVVEDCAQAFGAEYLPTSRQVKAKVGSLGDCGCLSFFPGKNLGCYGDGGMVLTNDASIYGKLIMLRNHGSSNKYFYKMHGFNSRLDTLQAAILLVKLKYIDKWIEMRLNNAKIYNQLIASRNILTPKASLFEGHAFNYYTVRVKSGRDILQARLKEKGIASAVYYPLCLHLQEVYKELGYGKSDFPVAEEAQEEVLSLPMYPELNKEQIQEIAAVIKQF
jgi:dTDP-4-amino-4,6-dideoxygalactose transaminase